MVFGEFSCKSAGVIYYDAVIPSVAGVMYFKLWFSISINFFELYLFNSLLTWNDTCRSVFNFSIWMLILLFWNS
jgi:hypothetical protein